MAVTFAQFHVGQTFKTVLEVEDAIRLIDEASSWSSPGTTLQGWRAVNLVLNWLVMEKIRLTPSICEPSTSNACHWNSYESPYYACTGDEVKGAFLAALKATEAMHASARPDVSQGDHVCHHPAGCMSLLCLMCWILLLV